MGVSFWRLVLLIISDIHGGTASKHADSQTSSWNNIRFSTVYVHVTICSSVRYLHDLADVSYRLYVLLYLNIL